ncbi:hypothetical protein HanRHA438_Chr16g0753081 [Helianthus annuus]|nr:hypothetical protein HanRHA438_Chr16g0753081 [Helianthus annuus]
MRKLSASNNLRFSISGLVKKRIILWDFNTNLPERRDHHMEKPNERTTRRLLNPIQRTAREEKDHSYRHSNSRDTEPPPPAYIHLYPYQH